MRIKNVIVTGILKVLQRINIEDLTVNQLNGLSTSELDSLSGTISNIQEQIQYVRNTVLEADSKARTFKSTIANDINSVVKSDVLDVDSEMSEFSDTIKNSVAMATSDATATASTIWSGRTAYVDGDKITGELIPIGGPCVEPTGISISGANMFFGIEPGLYKLPIDDIGRPLSGFSGAVSSKQNIIVPVTDISSEAGLVDDKLKYNETILGVTGSYTLDANATADKILSGYTAYVKGNKIQGNIITRGIHWADVSADDVGFDNSGFYMRMPVGYYPQRGSKAGYSYNHMNKSDLGNASAGNVLSGYTFTSQSGLKISGNMPEHASSGNVQNDSCWIYSDRIYVGFPTGFYPSASFGGMSGVSERYVTFGSLASTLGISGNKIIKGNTICGVSGTAATYDEGVNAAKQGTATAGDVLTGKTFTSSSGVNISGSMPDHTGVPSHINHRRLANGRYEVAVEYGRHGCYWAGNSYEYLEFSELASDIGLTANKIVSGNTILGINGLGSNIGVFSKICNISEGTWYGVDLSDSSWVSLGTDDNTSRWVYYHNLNLDCENKLYFVSASIIEETHGIRRTRGYASNSTTPQYIYSPAINMYGSIVDGTMRLSAGITAGFKSGFWMAGKEDSYYGSVFTAYDYNSKSSSSSGNSSFIIAAVGSNVIEFLFCKGSHSPCNIKSTTPKFSFTIGYIL